MFARAIRRTAEANRPDRRITLSEMLPRADDTWLRDAEGNRYTCELRLMARHLFEA